MNQTPINIRHQHSRIHNKDTKKCKYNICNIPNISNKRLQWYWDTDPDIQSIKSIQSPQLDRILLGLVWSSWGNISPNSSSSEHRIKLLHELHFSNMYYLCHVSFFKILWSKSNLELKIRVHTYIYRNITSPAENLGYQNYEFIIIYILLILNVQPTENLELWYIQCL